MERAGPARRVGTRPLTYDERQLNAKRIVCCRCGKAHYMTVVRQPCSSCRQEEEESHGVDYIDRTSTSRTTQTPQES